MNLFEFAQGKIESEEMVISEADKAWLKRFMQIINEPMEQGFEITFHGKRGIIHDPLRQKSVIKQGQLFALPTGGGYYNE